MRVIVLTAVLFNMVCIGLAAQTPAAELENLLASKAITYGQAARFALEASGKYTTRNANEAFEYAVNQGYLKDVEADQEARLDKISFLLTRSFDITGGMFYNFLYYPHYAYRELQYMGAIYGRTYPNSKVNGELFLFMVNRLLAETEQRNRRS